MVDDGSTDGTEEYMTSLGDRLNYYPTTSNQGHAGAMNLGVQNAQGDWIKPVNDDDYLAPNCLEEMTKAITLHTQSSNSFLSSCTSRY